MIVGTTPIVSKAYIDPGTGSMLFTVAIGLISAAIYGIRGLIIKLRFKLGSGKIEKKTDTLPFVIFSDNKRYWNSFKSICDEFETNKKYLTYLTMSKDDEVFNTNYQYIKPEYIGDNNKAFTKLNFLKADIVLSTTPGLDVYQWKRSKDVKYYVHIPHAPNDITLYRMFGIDYYDAILLSGEFQVNQIRKLESIRNLPNKDLKIVGLTYFDEMKKHLCNVNKIVKDNITVLVAPSWGPSSLLNRYGEKLIDELLKTNYQIIIRPHPQSFTSEKDLIDMLMNKYSKVQNIEWNNDIDNFDVLSKSDILISDFSGVLFDFSLIFDKPIIYADTSFDKSPYDAWWINESLWTFDILPKLGEQLTSDSIANIKTIIDKCIYDKKYIEGRIQARKQAYQNEGKAASTIYNYLVEKRNELSGE